MAASPLYSVFRAGDHPITCYRWVSQQPAQVGDFLTFMDAGTNFDWWDAARAVGVSMWDNTETAAALAKRKGFPYLAQVDFTSIDERTPWAHTGTPGHVTVWAPATIILPAVTAYIDIP